MKIYDILIRFFFRHIKWLIGAPLAVLILTIFLTRNLTKEYTANSVIYTGFTTGFSLDAQEGARVDYLATSNATDNLISIIRSKTTLEQVGIKLFAQSMVYGDPDEDNIYISAKYYRELEASVPAEVKRLIDRKSLDKTLDNLFKYRKEDKDNYIYGLIYYHHPFFSLEALSRVEIIRSGSSDMLELRYTCKDPALAYQTLLLLNEEFTKRYRDLRFSETNDVVEYFRRELAKAQVELNKKEDDLMIYSQQNRVINYAEQTKFIASQNEKLEVQYEQILLAHDGSKAALEQLEERLAMRAALIKDNVNFLNQLSAMGSLTDVIARKEAFLPDSLKNQDKSLTQFKQQEDVLREQIYSTAASIDHKKNTKEGIKADDILVQWLDELLRYEKSKAELEVMKMRRKQLDAQYEHFSPVGATLKRLEREVSIAEQKYLELLHSLTLALLKQKSLQISSASLKVVTEPMFPITNEPTKRKLICLLAFLASFMLVAMYFIVQEWLDRTLRDDYRAERLTGEKVIGVMSDIPKNAFTGSGIKSVEYDASQSYLTRAILKSANPDGKTIINTFSINSKEGKTFIWSPVVEELEKRDFKVVYLQHGVDFDDTGKAYADANSPEDLSSKAKETDYDICIVEHAAMADSPIPIPHNLLENSNLSLMVCDANRAWTHTDDLLLNRVKTIVNDKLLVVLNKTKKDVLEDFVGLLPPYTWFRKWKHNIITFNFTSHNDEQYIEKSSSSELKE